MKKVFILLCIIGAFILGFILLNDKQISPQPSTISQKCGVCGASLVHNVDGNNCAQGLTCKPGIITSLSYCVGQADTVEVCEKSQ